MDKLQHILIGSDLSPPADHALARALQLAGEHGSSLTAHHVLPPVPDVETLPPEWRTVVESETRLEARRDQALAALRARIRDSGAKDGAAELVVTTGAPFLELIQAARQRAAELIVVGAHGGHYLRDWLLGTTAERVIRKGGKPVLLVKQPPTGSYREILVAIDFSEPSKRALVLARRLAPAARLTLLHVYDFRIAEPLRAGGTTAEELLQLQEMYERERRSRLSALIREMGIDPEHARLLIRYGYPGLVISAVANELGADLVALGTLGLTGLRYVLLGSVAEHVLRESRCDVLAVPPAVITFDLP